MSWLTTKEAAAYAQMSPRSLTILARRKKIQHGSVGGRKYRFLPEHLDAYLLANGWNGKRRIR